MKAAITRAQGSKLRVLAIFDTPRDAYEHSPNCDIVNLTSITIVNDDVVINQIIEQPAPQASGFISY